MDRTPAHPLTPAEAKVRLRAAAEQLSLAMPMRQWPWRILAVAFAGGLLSGRASGSLITRATLIEGLAPMVLRTLLRVRRKAGAARQ